MLVLWNSTQSSKNDDYKDNEATWQNVYDLMRREKGREGGHKIDTWLSFYLHSIMLLEKDKEYTQRIVVVIVWQD